MHAPCWFQILSTREGNVMLPVIFAHGLRRNTEVYIECLELVVLIWVERVRAWRLCIWKHGFAPYYTRRSVGCEKISAIISTLKSGHLTPHMAIRLIIKCGAQLSERITKFRTILKDEMKTMITIAFTTLNKESVGKVCWTFWSRLKVQIEANSDFFK